MDAKLTVAPGVNLVHCHLVLLLIVEEAMGVTIPRHYPHFSSKEKLSTQGEILTVGSSDFGSDSECDSSCYFSTRCPLLLTKFAPDLIASPEMN
jgi:hypothetical protein